MDIQDAINIFFAPETPPPLLVALRIRLGKDENGFFSQRQILDYLKLSRATYRSLAGHELCFRELMHFQMAGELILKIEGNLCLEDRLYQELLFWMENPVKI